MEPNGPDPTPAVKSDANQGAAPGFFGRLFSFLFIGNDPERQRQRLLKQIAKELKKSRPKYFNPQTNMAEAPFARFFYEIYKALSPAQLLLRGARESGVLKAIVVEHAMSGEQAKAKEALSEKAVEERAKSADPQAISDALKNEVRDFINSFDVNSINEIDAAYNRLAVLLDLIAFDYYFLLCKFDASMPERDFAYKPRFEPIDCGYIVDELKDFLELVPAFDTEADWDALLTTLREYRSVEVISREGMRKVIQLLREVQRSGILLSIARHMDKNPAYKPLVRLHRDRIVEPYLAKVKSQAEITVQKILQSRKNEKLQALVKLVFGTASVSRLVNYSERSNTAFSKKMLGGFIHVTALNYLKAFLLDYFKKNIREIVDLLLIKGKWATNQPSQTISESYHQLLKISEAITHFDESLSEDGELGHKIANAAVKTDRDKKAVTNLRTLLKEINDQAGTMITEAVQNLVAIGRILKLAYEDFGKAHPELIVNWRELKTATDKDIRTLVASVYKQIYNFVQLIQFYK